MQDVAYKKTDIEETMRSAYLSYAMSVITARALPDVRDGLKPVQRRILYAMDDMGLHHDRPTRKSARIVGEVLGKYHPHGDSAVYEAMVRMAQDFSMRYPLVDGQGNFGSVDGDGAAAVRYTEARLSAMGDEMLTDLDKDAVDMGDNFDGTLKEPLVLPARLPNLLVNGVGGIAVGMATNIPPHNLGEIADAVAYLVDRYREAEDVTLDELMQFVKGPDFPTGGMILGEEGIRQAYATGRGRIVMRSQVHPEELSGGRLALIVTELPYQVNKSTLVGRIATLAREGRVEGIGDLRDESDRMGVRIVIELKRGVEWEPVLANLLKYSQLQATFGVNMLALVDGEPRTLSLKRALMHYIDHRYSVVERRTLFELERARRRAHVLEGLLIALDHLDEVIDTIRRSRTADTAKANLCKRFNFTEVQAQAILDLQLRRLAALERRRVQEEYREVIERIGFLQDLLSSEDKIRAVVKEEILDLKRVYGDPRRTRVRDLDVSTDVSAQDLVFNADVVLACSASGWVKRYPASVYHAGPGGLTEDLSAAGAPVLAVLRTNAQHKVAFVTQRGRAFALGAHQIPDLGQQPDGVTLGSLARLEDGEQVVALVSLDEADEEHAIALATAEGRVKRLTLAELNSVNRDVTTVFGLDGEDMLVGAVPADAQSEIMLVTAQGRVIRFAADDVRPQGLPATGMKGIDLKAGDRVVAIDAVQDNAELLIVSENGFGKRSSLREYGAQGRGGQGMLTLDTSKTAIAGALVGACVVEPGDQVLLGVSNGSLVQCVVDDIPRARRDNWGKIVTRTRSGAVVSVGDDEQVVSCIALRFSDGEASGGSPGPVPSPEEDGKPVATRTRRPRAKPASTVEQTSTASEKPAASTRRRSRRLAAAAAAPAEDTAPAARATRATARRTQEPAASATETPPTESARPAPSRRRSSKTAAASEEPQAEKPATTRPRRTRSTRAVNSGESPAADAAEAPTRTAPAATGRASLARRSATPKDEAPSGTSRAPRGSAPRPASQPESMSAHKGSGESKPDQDTASGAPPRRSAVRRVRQSPQRKLTGE